MVCFLRLLASLHAICLMLGWMWAERASQLLKEIVRLDELAALGSQRGPCRADEWDNSVGAFGRTGQLFMFCDFPE